MFCPGIVGDCSELACADATLVQVLVLIKAGFATFAKFPSRGVMLFVSSCPGGWPVLGLVLVSIINTHIKLYLEVIPQRDPGWPSLLSKATPEVFSTFKDAPPATQDVPRGFKDAPPVTPGARSSSRANCSDDKPNKYKRQCG